MSTVVRLYIASAEQREGKIKLCCKGALLHLEVGCLSLWYTYLLYMEYGTTLHERSSAHPQ